MTQLIVYDWNGTLLADNGAILEGTNKELAVLGLPPVDLGTYRRLYDIPIRKFYESLGVDLAVFGAKSEQLAEAFHAHYEPLALKARSRPGARQLLATMQTQGVAQIVLSNHTTEGIYLQLQRLKLLPYFTAVLANETLNGSHFKGKEERLSLYLGEHRIPANQAVIIGDTVEEVRIGRNLGLKTVSITGGYNSVGRLRAAGPDAIIHSLSALPKLIEEW